MEKTRFIDMMITQDEVKKEKKYTNYYEHAIYNSSFGLMNKRLDSPTVRSYFATKIYQYILECAKTEGIQLRSHNPEMFKRKLPYVIEGIMTILYHYNQIWDGKNCLDQISQLDVHIGGNVLRTSLQKYVYKNFDKKYRCRLMYKVIEEGIHYVDLGQYIDKFGNNYDCFSNKKSELNRIQNDAELINAEIEGFIKLNPIQHIIEDIITKMPGKASFIKLYFKRLYLISSSLFSILARFIINSLGYADGKEKDNILAFSDCYGIMMQVVNDNADFVPERATASKKMEDALNDLKNKNITLPLIYHLSSSHKAGNIDAYLETGQLRYLKNPNTILKEIIGSGALLKSMAVGREIAKKGKELVIPGFETSKYFSDMFGIAFNNRYYYHYYKARNCYKKGVDYRFEENLSYLKREPDEGKMERLEPEPAVF